MEKAYQPSEVETRLYDNWIKEQCFSGIVDPHKSSYSIVIPPPNVTGVLTMGHVLNNTIQDILARRQDSRENLYSGFQAQITQVSPHKLKLNRL